MVGCVLELKSVKSFTFLAVKKFSIFFTAKNVDLLGLHPIRK